MMAALIGALCGPCGPPTITWLVVAEWVDAVKRPSVWTRPHVAQECAEVALPYFAHAHAERAVPLVTAFLGIVAAFLRIAPRSIFSGQITDGSAVRDSSVAPHLVLAAPARRGIAARQVFAVFNARVAAIADAMPMRASRSADRARYNQELAESPTCQVVDVAPRNGGHEGALLFGAETPTAAHATIGEIGTADDMLISAVAQAAPSGWTRRVSSCLNDKSAEAFAGKVFQRIGHSLLYQPHVTIRLAA